MIALPKLLFCLQGCRGSDLANIFVAVNWEENQGAAANDADDANDDLAMMRFEFLEGLVRVAFGKYITPGLMDDASDAVKALCDHIKAQLPPEAQVDGNDFRRNRMYCREVEDVLIPYLDLITAMYKLYKVRICAR